MIRNSLTIWQSVLLFVFAFCGNIFAETRESVSIEDAFWAYDDGRISESELEELLFYIEGGDSRGACAEWEAAGGDPCARRLSEKLEEWKFRGSAGYAISLDSTGNVRYERSRLAFSFLRYSAEVRLKSENRGAVHVEHWRMLYKSKNAFTVLGNITAADIRSAIPLQMRTGNVWNLGTQNFEAGTILFSDTTAGIHAAIGRKEKLQLLMAGIASPEGFRDGFFRLRTEFAETQIAYSESYQKPLLYVAGNSPRNSWLRLRFRAYFHENKNLDGIFRVPKMVEKNRAFGNATVQTNFQTWNFRFVGSFAVPLDSGNSRVSAEASISRTKKRAKLESGTKVVSAGDSLAMTLFLRSGIRLFDAESLFCEWRETLRNPWTKSRYEIRPGALFFVEESVTAKALLIIRGPEKKPLVGREETQMKIAKSVYAKSLLELRAPRLRKLHLWRLGLEMRADF